MPTWAKWLVTFFFLCNKELDKNLIKHKEDDYHNLDKFQSLHSHSWGKKNANKLQTTSEIWLLEDFKIQIA